MSKRNVLIVNDMKMAGFLTKLDHLTYIQAFLGQENSVKVAAELAEVKPSQMLYFVRVMHSLGILRINRTVKRRGRSIHYYQAVADEFYVPVQHTPFENLEDFFRAGSMVMLDQQVHSQAMVVMNNTLQESYGFWMGYAPGTEDLQFRLSRKADVGLESDRQTHNLPQLASLPMAFSCRRIRLSKEKAERMRQLVMDLHSESEEAEGEYYFLRLVMTPEIK
jgi:hypothetical protein